MAVRHDAITINLVRSVMLAPVERAKITALVVEDSQALRKDVLARAGERG